MKPRVRFSERQKSFVQPVGQRMLLQIIGDRHAAPRVPKEIGEQYGRRRLQTCQTFKRRIQLHRDIWPVLQYPRGPHKCPSSRIPVEESAFPIEGRDEPTIVTRVNGVPIRTSLFELRIEVSSKQAESFVAQQNNVFCHRKLIVTPLNRLQQEAVA